MTINKEQRIGVFVDVQNMYYSARQHHSSKVNFKEILKEAVQGRKLIRAIAYAVKAGEKDEEFFHKALDAIGFEVKLKELQVFYGGAKKADWDTGIAMDMIELAPKLDALILVSGDGDFIPLVEHLRRALGCRVEVMAFGKSTSSKLREAADDFVDLDVNKKYLLKSI
ncbi:NYN domain-containing protein [Candidatus Woesearchaeota archaeon]|nr:NYN domain-containing protein [Candidatus Woesearchaeota archaeon]